MHEYLQGKNILLVDDNKAIGEMIKLYSSEFGINLKYIQDSRLVIEYLEKNDCDLIILDIAMPHIDGLELYQLINQNQQIPIIFLSARGQQSDRVNGLLLGAYDYLVKPFSLAELFLRIENIIVRNNSLLIVNNHLEIDLESRNIKYNDSIVKLTPKAFDLFIYLVKRKGTLCTREELMKNALGTEYYLEDRIIDAHIKEIRKKINSQIIQTVRGEGYIYDQD